MQVLVDLKVILICDSVFLAIDNDGSSFSEKSLTAQKKP